jgi:AraC-like DNA-binding protein
MAPYMGVVPFGNQWTFYSVVMAIFMDRHDVTEATTAEHVAQLHQQDLKVQDQFGCRGMTYWFDQKRKTAFCLIEAPDKNAIFRMHNHAHGQVPHKIIEVDPGIVESFLGRIQDPEKAQDTALNIINEPAFRTIMVLKLKPGSLKPRASLTPLLGDYLDPIVDMLNKAGGDIVRQNEGSFLVSFKSVTKAVQVSLEIKSYLYQTSKGEVVHKIGLSAGVPVSQNGSIFEDTIRIAERMCQVVAGQTVITSEVKELYDSENTKGLQQINCIRCLTRPTETFLNAFLDYTELNWKNTAAKIDDLARSLGCSRSKLYRSVISLTGLSPIDFLKEYRLNEALKLLKKNAGDISEIADETGFGSVSYFSKCFKRQYGYSPSENLKIGSGII